MKKDFFQEKLERMTSFLEVVIAVLIAAGVIIGLFDLIRYFPFIWNGDAKATYDIFQSFLSHALILIVGVELILMIINQTTKGILELVLFVIARKMLIYADTMLDLVLGTVAIALVFLILRFLVTNDEENLTQIERKVGSKKENKEEDIEEN